jgi:hypothetical protein
MNQHMALEDTPDPTDLHAREKKPILDWSPAFMFMVTAEAAPRSARVTEAATTSRIPSVMSGLRVRHQTLVHPLGIRRERWLNPGGFGGYGNPPHMGLRKKATRRGRMPIYEYECENWRRSSP